MLPNDPLKRVLFVDLTRRRFHVEERPDIFETGLGGSGVAIRLLEELCPEGADSLGEENPIILTVGPLTGFYPLASKTVAMFKSPHTGNLGESHAGGRSAIALRMAGYGALVVQGQSEMPIYLVINEEGAAFRDASALWGTRSSYTAGSVLRKREPGSGYRTIMRIGRAGERQVSYACVINDPYFYKTLMLSYDHEPIFATGSMLGIKDVSGMLQLMDEVEIQGLDVMSTGVALAWATEALEGGLNTTEDTDGITLAFGEADAYREATRRIVDQPTDFYRALAHGVDHAASLYGGEDFALAFGGNEMPGYHTGPGCHIGYLTGARHSHLDSAGYSLDQNAAHQGQELTPEGIAQDLIEEERWRQTLTSLVICLFARRVYDPETILQALATTGYDWTQEDLDHHKFPNLLRKA